MTPSHYIAAIVATGLLCLSYLIKTRNREIDLVINIFLCLSVGAFWSSIIVHEIANRFFPGQLSEIGIFVISTILGLFAWCVLVVLTWREPRYINEENSICYTPDILIGLHGFILMHEGGDLYLGYIDDSSKSQIYIHIISDEKVEPDTEFVISEIKGDKIYATVA